MGKRKSIDCSGFYELSSDWHAYWLGFLAADGCIYVKAPKNEVRLQVVLKENDLSHLYNLQLGLKTTRPVTHGFNGQRNVAQFIIHDHDLVNALAYWGIVPNKTLTMLWPAQLPASVVPAYIRGYFDGDGTIYHRHRLAPGTHWTETVCRFISGSIPFLEGLAQELRVRGISTFKIYRNQETNAFFLPLSTRRENLLAFADLLYKDCTVCLERKRIIFREMEAYHAAHPRKGSHLRYQAS